MLSVEQQEKYLKAGGHRCPHCGSNSISSASMDSFGRAYWCTVECHDCEREWTDHFELVDISEQERGAQ